MIRIFIMNKFNIYIYKYLYKYKEIKSIRELKEDNNERNYSFPSLLPSFRSQKHLIEPVFPVYCIRGGEGGGRGGSRGGVFKDIPPPRGSF